MASDCFLKMGTYDGEATAEGHEKEIEVLSWNWNVARGEIGRGDFGHLVFIHKIDKASPNLLMACMKKETVDEAKLTVRKELKGPQKFLIITMNKVMVASVNPALKKGAEGMEVVEEVKLSFSKVHYAYHPDNKDKTALDAPATFEYEVDATK